jgi:tetratricopeptide (TPR) repeat protein
MCSNKKIDVINDSAFQSIQQNDLTTGIKLLKESLELNSVQPVILFNLALCLRELNFYHESIYYLDKILEINPSYSQVLFLKAEILKKINLLDESIDTYKHLATLNPKNPEIYFNLGNIFFEKNDLNLALENFDRAIQLDANFFEAYNNKGNCERELGNFNEALKAYIHCLELNPNITQIYINIGNIYKDKKEYKKALEIFQQAISAGLNSAEIHFNKGNVEQELSKFEDSIRSYDSSIAVDKNFYPALWNKALVCLMLGNFAEGWKLYEYRWLDQQRKFKRNLNGPLWLGSPSQLKGKSLLIYTEQGLGDAIQFSRYASLLKKTGALIIFECQGALIDLFKTLDKDFILIERGQDLPPFDYHCPIMSLPFAFKTELNTIPARVPYLKVNQDKKVFWKKHFDANFNHIGIVCSGSKTHKEDAFRSIPLAFFEEILDLPYQFHLIQKEIRDADLVSAKNLPIKLYIDDIHNFSDTAAIIECMDLIISVDTSVAHLAGALNYEVLLLLPYIPDYRWMFEGNSTPWYPSFKLIRQDDDRCWHKVLDDVKKILTQSSKLNKKRQPKGLPF